MPTPTLPRRAVRDGLLSDNLHDLDRVSLMGSRCAHCGETSLGINALCPNCGRDTVQVLPLSRHGTLWTFTVVRHKPPGNYKGPDPFVPFGLGLVELPEGLRVLAPLAGSPEQLKIGMPMDFHAFVRPVQPSDEAEVVQFAFQSIDSRTGSAL